MAQFRKAYIAAGVALVGGVGAALADGALTPKEVGISVGAALLAAAAVYRIPNEV